jgi:hypothetical protein
MPKPMPNQIPRLRVCLGAAQPASKDNASSSTPQWNLLGVVAGVSSGQGSALIVVDGQPAKVFLPGQTVAPGWVLHSVGHRLARLAPSLQEAPSVRHLEYLNHPGTSALLARSVL